MKLFSIRVLRPHNQTRSYGYNAFPEWEVAAVISAPDEVTARKKFRAKYGHCRRLTTDVQQMEDPLWLMKMRRSISVKAQKLGALVTVAGVTYGTSKVIRGNGGRGYGAPIHVNQGARTG